MDFITGGTGYDECSTHAHLLEIGYKGPITALHLMMNLGFRVIKPDIVLTRLFFQRGWLHRVVHGLPRDLTAKDLVGKGRYGTRYKYTKARIYKPVVCLAREIVDYTAQNALDKDIGWVTRNPIREFDIFTVLYGQEPDKKIGIVRNLSKGKHSAGRCRVLKRKTREGSRRHT
jgi:hypothetical protein